MYNFFINFFILMMMNGDGFNVLTIYVVTKKNNLAILISKYYFFVCTRCIFIVFYVLISFYNNFIRVTSF